MVVLASHTHTAYLAERLVEDVTREAVSADVGGFGGVENDSFLLRIDPPVGVPHADTAVAIGCFIVICFIQRLAHESQGDCAAMTRAGVELAAVDGGGQRPVVFGRYIFVSERSAIVRLLLQLTNINTLNGTNVEGSAVPSNELPHNRRGTSGTELVSKLFRAKGVLRKSVLVAFDNIELAAFCGKDPEVPFLVADATVAFHRRLDLR